MAPRWRPLPRAGPFWPATPKPPKPPSGPRAAGRATSRRPDGNPLPFRAIKSAFSGYRGHSFITGLQFLETGPLARGQGRGVFHYVQKAGQGWPRCAPPGRRGPGAGGACGAGRTAACARKLRGARGRQSPLSAAPPSIRRGPPLTPSSGKVGAGGLQTCSSFGESGHRARKLVPGAIPPPQRGRANGTFGCRSMRWLFRGIIMPTSCSAMKKGPLPGARTPPKFGPARIPPWPGGTVFLDEIPGKMPAVHAGGGCLRPPFRGAGPHLPAWAAPGPSNLRQSGALAAGDQQGPQSTR